MSFYNIKKFSFVKNSGGRESLSSKNEEKEECIIDLCNGFYELPKFIPSSRIRIKPRLIRIDKDEIKEEFERINYIRSLMTVALIYHSEFSKFYNIFDDESIPNIFFEVSELNISDHSSPFIKVLMNDKEKNLTEIKMFLRYKNNLDGSFSINIQHDLDSDNMNDVLSNLGIVLGNNNYFFTFDCSLIN